MENSYTYRLIGIMANGGDDVRTINASCETEAEIIIESFHDGGYCLLYGGDDDDDSWEFYYDDAIEEMEAELDIDATLHHSWQDTCTAEELAASF